MNQNITIIENPSINEVKGFYSNACCCEIKKKDKLDLGIVYSEKLSSVFAVYTTNKYQAAPILVCKKHLTNNKAQALIVNSGNANACTGNEGIQNAEIMCEETAKILGIKKEDVVVSSTGVIGQNLPMEKIKKGILELKDKIKAENKDNFSLAIMTTDTKMKVAGVKVKIDGVEYKIVGTTKGSGMIHPNMATMLGYIFTDANIEDSLLEKVFKNSIQKSFNSVTVDGDTSTNDTGMIFKNGMANNKIIDDKSSAEYAVFCEALEYVATSLAKQIVLDGEGATKLIELNVVNADTEKQAKNIGVTVAKSSLVKTAFFGEDANWGRIICAVGYSGEEFDINKVKLSFGNLMVFENGRNLNFSEEDAKKILSQREIKVTIDMGCGNKNWTYWTCDLSYDYVKINGSYRS
ncbi:MAG: bifunctional ornithine acetyltransferase/N-acetylglutamate synthase [Spirochaetes bacterium GWD1_27_9]|nr:MAG: bifunctional ornithine acetyltransferase/N-acetylglutamate synthase [Spirochaetes bacterium GWC1_27_15]OHD34498.1 MAG: bifunctional ornithine acetyltransferase/N-acetylglutamate synthase [Spirochaetes bacterium GWD1_27_9]